MTRHSKVFVPVSEVSENSLNSFSIYTAFSSKEKEWLLMEEKENVYVLTEQELIALLIKFEVRGRILKDEERLRNLAITFLKSKTNPQTENK